MTEKRTKLVCRCAPLIMTVCCFVGAAVRAQNSSAGGPAPSITDKLTTPASSATGAWTEEQIATMNRIRDAAMNDPYAYNELMYLTDSIGPRLTGSPQAAAAVQWVTKEMRSTGADVSLEQTTVPHWVRGEESASLTVWPGMTPNTSQKIVITALVNSVATLDNRPGRSCRGGYLVCGAGTVRACDSQRKDCSFRSPIR
jgi:carboxypeptidase Q